MASGQRHVDVRASTIAARDPRQPSVGPRAEHVEADRFEPIENAHAAEPGRAQLPAQAAADGVRDRPAVTKERARLGRTRRSSAASPRGRQAAPAEIALVGARLRAPGRGGT